MKYGLFSIGIILVGCNLVTGADGLRERDEDDDGAGADMTSGTGGASSSASGNGVGVGGSSSTGSGSGVGGATGSSSSASGTGGATSSSSSSAASGSGGGGSGCGGAGPGSTTLDTEEQAFLTLINNYRMQNGRSPLTHCISMDRAAQGHSEDMAVNDYFDHTGLNNSTPSSRSCDACFDLGCGPSTAMGENIAAGNSAAQATFTQWQNSPGHNANMLSPNYTMIGIGRAFDAGSMYGWYWTNVFAGDDEPSCY